MSGGDPDPGLGAALPPPPPPAPSRREAAIGEAMRRFDGADATRPPIRTPASAGRPPWFRPQLAGLLTVALVVLAGVPLLWLALQQRPIGKLAAGHPAMVPTPEIPPAPVPAPGSAPGKAMQDVLLREAVPASRVVAETSAPIADMPPATAPPPPPVLQAEAPPAAPMREEAHAKQAAPAMAARGAMPDADSRERDDRADLVVTARRTNRSRPDIWSTPGDWNACTVDDPRQNLSACRRRFDKTASGASGAANALVAEGLTQAWQGDRTRAIELFDRAIQLEPGSAPAWLNRALARAGDGDIPAALADIDRAVRLAPRSAQIRFVRGRLLKASGDRRRADRAFEEAAALDPAYEGLGEGPGD